MRILGHGQERAARRSATTLRRRALVERWHGRTIEQEGQESRHTGRRADRYRRAGAAVRAGAAAVLKVVGLARERTSDLIAEFAVSGSATVIGQEQMISPSASG
jgi:hypothetical protein